MQRGPLTGRRSQSHRCDFPHSAVLRARGPERAYSAPRPLRSADTDTRLNWAASLLVSRRLPSWAKNRVRRRAGGVVREIFVGTLRNARCPVDEHYFLAFSSSVLFRRFASTA